MSHSRPFAGLPQLVLLLALSACGGGDGVAESHGPPPPASVRTLAYVTTECHEDKKSVSLRQTLQILNGDRAPVTVMDIPSLGLPTLGSACVGYGQYRIGAGSVVFAAFTRIRQSPDASTVVFEVNFDLSEQRSAPMVRGSSMTRRSPSGRARTLTAAIPEVLLAYSA